MSYYENEYGSEAFITGMPASRREYRSQRDEMGYYSDGYNQYRDDDYQDEDEESLYNRVYKNPKPSKRRPEEYYGKLFNTKSANEWSRLASLRPDPDSLWHSLWHEDEICCLFADSNIGKSIYAVQIAAEISREKRVIYFDFEMSDKQFQRRYTADNGYIYNFDDNFYRAEMNSDMINPETFEEDVIYEIKRQLMTYRCKVVILDNLTYLCSEAERGDAASRLMMNLISLKKELGLSILVLAHTPKRPLSSPITQNDLAGSKKLFNFFDSCFAMGKSGRDEKLRYVKQLKARAGAIEYGAGNVIVYEIVRDDGWLHFEEVDHCPESRHLKENTDADRELMFTQVHALKESGKSQREIAREIGISLSKVHRILNANKHR